MDANRRPSAIGDHHPAIRQAVDRGDASQKRLVRALHLPHREHRLGVDQPRGPVLGVGGGFIST